MKKVTSGSPLNIPAETFNTFVDAARDFQSRQHGSSKNRTASSPQGGVILIKNTSGSDIDVRFGIMAIDGILIEPSYNEKEFQSRPALTGIIPTADTVRFVILQQPLKNDKVGRALLYGITAVRLNVISEDHKYAVAIDAESDFLESAPAGLARTLWKETGTGEVWALVELNLGGGIPTLFEATSNAAGNVITGKEVKSDGSIVGNDQEFWAMD